MSGHYRELQRILSDAIGNPDFEGATTIDETKPIKQLFAAKTIVRATAGDVASTGFQPVHEYAAMTHVCNALISYKQDAPASPVDEVQDDAEARLVWKFLANFASDSAALAVMDAALSRAAVSLHYVAARPQQFDMFIHLSAAEMFFIDGDSLLIAALSSQQVDWDLTQPLHVLRNAETLLSGLKERGAHFHVVFFEDTLWFWEKAPQKMFIRENLRLALTTAAESNPASGLVVTTFPSFHSKEFSAYVAKFEPEFFLMSDGEQLAASGPLHELFDNHNITAEEARDERLRPYRSVVEDPVHGEDVSFYFHCFLLWALSKRIKVAYSSRIIARENAIVVFAVTASSNKFADALALVDSVVALAKGLEHPVALPELTAGAKAIADDADIGLREQIVDGALQAFLHTPGARRTKEEVALCQALAIAVYAVSFLTAELRAQQPAMAPEVVHFLNEIAPYFVQVLRYRGCLTGRGAEFDLYDGHLLAVIAFLLQKTPLKDLLDEDGMEDINVSWSSVVGDDNADLATADFTALPEVTLLPTAAVEQQPRLAHDLVERLAKCFHVPHHTAGAPYPTDFGEANQLSGWIISKAFDNLNDVVDSQAEEEANRNLTDREKRMKLEMDAAFVRDAARQAESMGIRGFTTERLAVVRSESDEDEAAAAAGTGTAAAAGGSSAAAAKKGAATKQHAGQKSKKARSKEDIIREEAAIRDANRVVREASQQVDNVLKSADPQPDRTSHADRLEAISLLNSAISKLNQNNFGRKFDPGETLKDDEQPPLKLYVWRLLVDASGMREAEFVFTVDDPKDGAAAQKKSSAASAKSADNVYAFSVIRRLVDECCGQQGKENASWGKLERLHQVSASMNSPYDALSYLTWTYLSYVQLHFQLKLMGRIVKLYLDNWKAERERARLAQEQPDIKIGTPLFLFIHHRVFSMIRDYGLAISGDELNLARAGLMHFDFPPTYYDKVDRAVAAWQNKPLQPVPPTLRPRFSIFKQPPEMMQLMHMGHLLERPIIPEKDYRVVFNPDGWQRELLDIVDRRGSAVVCAPTSAGKTFISYYCMYNALKTSNTKIVVYLAPSRALINQAVADVCARYGSKKYDVAGKNVFGVHGGDAYHRYHDNCQVLVTLPEVLETLLLSPNHKDWAERLDYVILDEIHTMESSGNGDVWERVFALLPCPFIALSATLGETQQLCGWLNRTQTLLRAQQQERSRDYTVYEIPGDGASIQRWNDIKKYIYLPPPGYRPQLKKLTAKYEKQYIHDLHPLSILTLDQLRRGFPPDISLVPSEVVQLQEKMLAGFEKSIWPTWSSVQVVVDMAAQLRSLRPEVYFAKENYITQRQARQFEADVKNAFVYWVYLTTGRAAAGFDTLAPEKIDAFNSDMHHLCESILHSFSRHLREDEALLDKEAIAYAKRQLELQQRTIMEAAASTAAGGADSGNGNGNASKAGASAAAAAAALAAEKMCFPDSKEFISINIINVLRELNAREMGPTIVFSFESEDCDDLVKAVVEQLEAAEATYRLTDEFAQYKAAMQRKADAKEAARKQRESNLKQKRLTTDDNGDVERMERDMDNGDDGLDDDCIVPDVLPEFTFIGQGCTVEPEVVRNAVEECKKRGDDLAARAIQRGVGIHHAGVKGKLRRMMEILFRGRHCGVICATETLALGVHSPCRSVVLAGDHVLLNTTQFRQMMGRAGRRGLDYLGHLIFLSVSMKKITRLMTSSMTVIKGNVQMDPVTQLRVLQLYDFASHRGEKEKSVADWQARALSMIERMCVNPLFFQGRAAVEGGNMETFTVEFLQMLLAYVQAQGLHFADRPSSLGSLLVDVMHVFRNAQVGAEGFSFMSMLTNGTFDRAGFSAANLPESQSTASIGIPAGASKDEAVAELLAYLFSVNRMCGVPLEIHRSVLADPSTLLVWKKGGTARQHRVVLMPLRACCDGNSRDAEAHDKPFDSVAAFRMLSSFYASLAERLQEPSEDRLPFMSSKTKKKAPIFSAAAEDMPLCAKLKETAVPFKARAPFVALSGCGDHFLNTDDLATTLRRGLFFDRRLLPALDLVDGCRHDGAQVLINACVTDFARCKAQIDSVRQNYRFTLLENLNGLTQSESFGVLNQVERMLANVSGLARDSKGKVPMHVLGSLFPEDSDPNAYFAGAQEVLRFATQLHDLRSMIDKDYSGDQLRAKQAETSKQRAAERAANAAAARN